MSGKIKIMLFSNRPDKKSGMTDLSGDDRLSIAGVADVHDNLFGMVKSCRPDVIIVDTPSPSRVLISRLTSLRAVYPCPIAMIANEGDNEQITAAVEAGVNAFTIEITSPESLAPFIDLAVAQFGYTEKLTQQRDSATTALEERKTIERAKGIVMKQRGLDEDAAYKFLRQAAMNRNVRLGHLAETILQTEELLN